MIAIVKSKLTPERFDRLVGDQPKPVKPPRVIWGASAIGYRIGVSADFVRDRLVHEPGSPIRKKAGKYCVIEDELIAFFRA